MQLDGEEMTRDAAERVAEQMVYVALLDLIDRATSEDLSQQLGLT